MVERDAMDYNGMMKDSAEYILKHRKEKITVERIGRLYSYSPELSVIYLAVITKYHFKNTSMPHI
jgi:hypothetical protein